MMINSLYIVGIFVRVTFSSMSRRIGYNATWMTGLIRNCQNRCNRLNPSTSASSSVALFMLCTSYVRNSITDMDAAVL